MRRSTSHLMMRTVAHAVSLTGTLIGTRAIAADVCALGCLAGPGVTAPQAGCGTTTFAALDHDNDGDVDLADYARFSLVEHNGVTVRDAFGRRANEFGLRLVDWEGQLANPLVSVTLYPPPCAAFPATALLTAEGMRLYFGGAGSVGATGPQKTLVFNSATQQTVTLAIFPDHDFEDEAYTLTIDFFDGAGVQTQTNVPITVVDQDRARALEYAINVNFARDESGFFGDVSRRAVVQQAADDWAYFLANPGYAVVGAGTQQTWIWDWPLAWTAPPYGAWIVNSTAYDGYLLYAYGIQTPELRSGGDPSTCCFHKIGSTVTTLRRGGGLEAEIQGNYNTLGWRASTDDDEWWLTGNLGHEVNDLYSIVHHEMGHALGFNSGYPGFAAGEAAAIFNTPQLAAYYGGAVPVRSTDDHFPGVVDPASGVGIFGNEYFGAVPRRRWLITKLDLLLLQAVGYPLRATSAFQPLALANPALPNAAVDQPYAAALTATGGLPFYDWRITGGGLPPGLALDRYTGTIGGTPTSAGTFPFDLEVRDRPDAPGVTAGAMVVVE